MVNEKKFCMCLNNTMAHSSHHSNGGERAALLRGAKWQPGAEITVTFLEGSSELQSRVKEAAELWISTGRARLTFRWVKDVNANIRIAFMQGQGSWSYLGTGCLRIASPKPTMNYGWLTDSSTDEEVRQVVLHEFGHALGLIHEHQNPEGAIQWDEAAVIADLSGPPNYWSESQIRSNVLDRYTLGSVVATSVDPKSIMMYPIPGSWTGGTFSTDFNSGLSESDIELIASEYQ